MVYFITDTEKTPRSQRLEEVLRSVAGAAGCIPRNIISREQIIGFSLEDIRTGKRQPLAILKSEVTPKQELLFSCSHGRYLFSPAAFDFALATVKHGIDNQVPALFVAEFGKLELQKRGLFPAARLAVQSGLDVYCCARKINIQPAVELLSLSSWSVIPVLRVE